MGAFFSTAAVSKASVAVALHARVSLLLLGGLVASLIRLATGASTVALTTAAGILDPILAHSLMGARSCWPWPPARAVSSSPMGTMTAFGW